jgi:hypothetical protein
MKIGVHPSLWTGCVGWGGVVVEASGCGGDIEIYDIHTHIMQVRYFAATYSCCIIAIQTIIDGACSSRPFL